MAGCVQVIVKIAVLMGIGIFCRKKNILTDEGIRSVKNLVIQIMLPVMIFNSLLSVDYSGDLAVLMIVMFSETALGLVLGFALKRTAKLFDRIFPYMLTCAETGMVGYALIAAILGEDSIHYMAMIGVGPALFAFSVYFSMLSMTVGQKAEGKDILKNVATSPTLLASILGMAGGLSPVGGWLLSGSFGAVFSEVVSAITAPVSTIMLIAAGYSFVIRRAVLKEAIKTTVLRYLIWGMFCAVTCFLFWRYMYMEKNMLISLVVFMMLPPSFIITVYVREKDEMEYVSVTTSACLAVTLVVSAVAAVFV